MSYWASLVDGDGHTVQVEPHGFKGGTYQAGGSNEAELNVTYNYGSIIRQHLHEDGLRWLDGKPAGQTIGALELAFETLDPNDTDPDYWKACQGNVRKAIGALLAFARFAPNATWEVH